LRKVEKTICVFSDENVLCFLIKTGAFEGFEKQENVYNFCFFPWELELLFDFWPERHGAGIK